MPNASFGQHYASAFRFNDEVDQEELYQEALKHYANTLTPFGDRVLKKIDEVLALDLPVSMIAPSHGVTWRDEPLQIVRQYREWATEVPEARAVILHDTMREGMRQMMEANGEGLGNEGVPYKVFQMAVSDRNDVITELFRAKAIADGEPRGSVDDQSHPAGPQGIAVQE